MNSVPMTACRRAGLVVKAAFDRVAAAIALIVLSPLLLVIAVSIKLTSPGPVFFRQQRAGLWGRPFWIYKFRTMVVGAERIGLRYHVTADDPRITPLGRLLRRLSLDELPQLINVLRGEMSLVGPRPTLLYQVERYDARQRLRLAMRPGITGWAQVNGRSTLPWSARIEHDIWYVEHWSLWLDLVILLRTFSVIFQSEGVYHEGAGDAISRQDEPAESSSDASDGR